MDNLHWYWIIDFSKIGVCGGYYNLGNKLKHRELNSNNISFALEIQLIAITISYNVKFLAFTKLSWEDQKWGSSKIWPPSKIFWLASLCLQASFGLPTFNLQVKKYSCIANYAWLLHLAKIYAYKDIRTWHISSTYVHIVSIIDVYT